MIYDYLTVHILKAAKTINFVCILYVLLNVLSNDNHTHVSLQPSFSKKKVSRKYKIRAQNRIHEAFIRSKAKAIVHQELEFGAYQELKFNEAETSFSMPDSSNDGIHVGPQQYSMNINNEIFINDNIQYDSSVDNDDTWINDDNHENIYCNEFENETVTHVFQNGKEMTGLRNWGLYNISKRKVDDILKLFRPILHFLPKSYKSSLLRTPRKVLLQVVGIGQMWYKGIRHNIEQRMNYQYLINNGSIFMDVNIDGISLQKDCSKQFWPILGRFAHQKYPFIIGVFFSRGKPSNLNLYLHNYIVEVAELIENGFECNGTVFPFCVRNFSIFNRLI